MNEYYDKYWNSINCVRLFGTSCRKKKKRFVSVLVALDAATSLDLCALNASISLFITKMCTKIHTANYESFQFHSIESAFLHSSDLLYICAGIEIYRFCFSGIKVAIKLCEWHRVRNGLCILRQIQINKSKQHHVKYESITEWNVFHRQTWTADLKKRNMIENKA